MTTYGIWSDSAGGFISTNLHASEREAELARWLTEGEDDAAIAVMCEAHLDDEQVDGACDLCDEDEDEDEDEDDDA